MTFGSSYQAIQPHIVTMLMGSCVVGHSGQQIIQIILLLSF